MNYKIFIALGVVLLLFGCTQAPPAGNSNTTTVPAAVTAAPAPTAATSADVMAKDVVDVQLVNTSFSPNAITVKAGTTLRITNKDSFDHDLGIDNFFPSQVIKAGQSVEVKMTQTGTFSLVCARHSPSMEGSITVN